MQNRVNFTLFLETLFRMTEIISGPLYSFVRLRDSVNFRNTDSIYLLNYVSRSIGRCFLGLLLSIFVKKIKMTLLLFSVRKNHSWNRVSLNFRFIELEYTKKCIHSIWLICVLMFIYLTFNIKIELIASMIDENAVTIRLNTIWFDSI